MNRATKLTVIACLVDALELVPGQSGREAAAQAASENVMDAAIEELVDEVLREIKRKPVADLRLIHTDAPRDAIAGSTA